MSDFWLITTAILLEGLPFALLGGVIAASLEVWLPRGFPEWVTRPRPKLVQIGLGMASAFVLPVCECSSIPFVKKMLAKGMPRASAYAFLFAAPLVNPMCLASTYLAFAGVDPWFFVAARTLGGLWVVACLAWWLSGRKVTTETCTASEAPLAFATLCGCAVCKPSTDAPQIQRQSRTWADRGEGFLRWLQVAAEEFLEVAGYLAVGSCLVAAVQIWVDRAWIEPLAEQVWLAPFASVGLAYTLCLCSSVDAFVVAALPPFTTAARLAFLVAGPLFDLKLFFLYQSLFNKRTALLIGVVVATLAVLLSWGLSWSGL